MKTPQTILHVDDDPDILRLVARLLGHSGFNVVSCDDPTKAVEVLASSGARLVILDMDMPEIDGLTLLQQIKQHDGRILAIMLSGVVTMTTALKSMALGAEACVFKPIENTRPLYHAVEAAIRKIEAWQEAIRELEKRRTRERNMVNSSYEI